MQVRYTRADGYLANIADGVQNYTFRDVDDLVRLVPWSIVTSRL